jgi:nucleoside phosphorylase
VRVVETGVALRKRSHDLGDVVISCGLAGGLHSHLASGTILIPHEVRRPDGTTLACDAQLVAALIAGARSLGREPVTDLLLTAETIVRGESRAHWSKRGHAGADMETGLLRAARVAAVRVVLDTPGRELSADWLDPLRAMLKPQNWVEALWLAREAPRYARLAARVVAAACR